MAERVRVREFTDDDDNQVLWSIRRGSASVARW